MEALGENILLKIVSFITDPVTTTDELIPSGETSSYRSNPLALAEFTLSRKDPGYVERAKEVRDRKNQTELELVQNACAKLALLQEEKSAAPDSSALPDEKILPIQTASAIYAVKPGDGSAREQAASCQRVLGGLANFANEYATKRYRSNLINWGIIPFIIDREEKPPFENGDYIFIPGIKKLLQEEKKPGGELLQEKKATGHVFRYVSGRVESIAAFTALIPDLNQNEKELLLAGSLINYNSKRVENNG
jgi:aconitate hydratase